MANKIQTWKMFYPDDWHLDEVCNYSCFIYLIQFSNSLEHYIGIKRVYRGIKDYADVKHSSTESDWKRYNSSSKTVQQRIKDGEPHKKSILWCFKTLAEGSVAETALIAVLGTRWDNLNRAIMTTTRIKKDNGDQFRVIQRILEDLV